MGRAKIIILIIGIVLTILFTSVFDACSSPSETGNKTFDIVPYHLVYKANKHNMTEAEEKMSTDLYDLVKKQAHNLIPDPEQFQMRSFSSSADFIRAVF